MRANYIIQFLKEKGFRLTETRQSVAVWLEKNKGIFSAAQIMAENKSLDKVSVYRTLELLARYDIIHPVQIIDDGQYYEVHEPKHHHHVMCVRCKDNQCVPCAVKEQKIKGFSRIHHTVFLTGICSLCNL